MLHLSHTNDEVAFQVLGFLRAMLYFGNRPAQAKIGHLCSHKDSKFFQRLHKLLDIVVTNLGHSDFKESVAHEGQSVNSISTSSVRRFC